MKVIVGVGFAMLVWIVGYYLHFLPLPKPEIYQFITLTLISIVQPMVIYLTVKRNYESSNHLREELEITLKEDQIEVQGQSFLTVIAWKKVFKIDEIKNWFLIYQNNLSAILIGKKDLSEKDIAAVRKLLGSIQGPPVHLMDEHLAERFS